MKYILSFIIVLFTFACDAPEIDNQEEPITRLAERPEVLSTDSVELLQPKFVKEFSTDAEKSRRGVIIVYKKYSGNVPGIYKFKQNNQTSTQFFEVITKDDRYIARVPNGKYILELVETEDYNIIYPRHLIRQGDKVRHGWPNYFIEDYDNY